MRFNSRELAQIAQQSASVDKEGVLYMKERQDSIFKRTEGRHAMSLLCFVGWCASFLSHIFFNL